MTHETEVIIITNQMYITYSASNLLGVIWNVSKKCKWLEKHFYVTNTSKKLAIVWSRRHFKRGMDINVNKESIYASWKEYLMLLLWSYYKDCTSRCNKGYIHTNILTMALLRMTGFLLMLDFRWHYKRHHIFS